MKTLANIAGRFRQEEDGAALIEYTVLLGIIVATVIALIGFVGVWINSQWSTLCGKLPGATCA